MKIVNMRTARQMLGDTTSRTGAAFAKFHGLKLIQTDAKHGNGRAVFFDEAEVLALCAKKEAEQQKRNGRNTAPTPQSMIAHRKIRTVARALVDLYGMLGEPCPEALIEVAER